jgi:hypothetical protein
MVNKERGILARNIQNEADWSQLGMRLQISASHNNEGAYQEAPTKANAIWGKLRDKKNLK